MVTKYLSGASAGTPFTGGTTASVLVTSEALNPTSGYPGDSITYTATVKNSGGTALPSTFVASLYMGAGNWVWSGALGASVYSGNFFTTVPFTVPVVGSGVYTTYLTWAQQSI